MTLQSFKPETFQLVDLKFFLALWGFFFFLCSNMDGIGTRLRAELSEFESGKGQESFFFP
jgi:hypothetical protein